jgi:hypothetical protein
MKENGVWMYKVSSVPNDQDILGYIGEQHGFDDTKGALKDFVLTEFTLAELGLPDHKEILDGVLKIKDQVGLQGWKNYDYESTRYRGFSLTYNPDFKDKSVSQYHQTWGSEGLTQNFGRVDGINETDLKNTYYDSYGFREPLPLVQEHLGFFLNKFKLSLIRSRVAFLNLFRKRPSDSGWHVDEPPFHLIRCIVPLQTSLEYVLEVNGDDEFGNTYQFEKHLETGKIYFWNTRIPHKVGVNKFCKTVDDRIHLIMGFTPWYDYDKENDAYIKSSLYGMPISQLINEKHFLAAK